jgi:hypothetical protein
LVFYQFCLLVRPEAVYRFAIPIIQLQIELRKRSVVANRNVVWLLIRCAIEARPPFALAPLYRKVVLLVASSRGLGSLCLGPLYRKVVLVVTLSQELEE